VSADQDVLLGWTARRLRAAGPDLATGPGGSGAHPPPSAAELEAAARAAQEARDGSLAVCVIAGLDMTAWIRETCRFASGVPRADAEGWRRSFTRTVFLSGRPANLRHRFAFAHTAADGSTAWAGPAPAPATATLRRLLKTFEGPCALDTLPGPGTGGGLTVDLPPGPRPGPGSPPDRPPVHRELHVATAGVTLAQTLVHLNHLLVEAVFDGLVAPGDRLTVRRAPRLAGIRGPVAALRAATETHRPDRLRAYALLTEECR
jgi:hypothetical protein